MLGRRMGQRSLRWTRHGSGSVLICCDEVTFCAPFRNFTTPRVVRTRSVRNSEILRRHVLFGYEVCANPNFTTFRYVAHLSVP